MKQRAAEPVDEQPQVFLGPCVQGTGSIPVGGF